MIDLHVADSQSVFGRRILPPWLATEQASRPPRFFVEEAEI
jgi:hypothetical protein